MNLSSYGLLRPQANCRYNIVIDARKSVEGFESKPSGQLGTTSDHFENLSFRYVQVWFDTNTGIFRGSNESGEQEGVPSSLLDFVECLLAPCST